MFELILFTGVLIAMTLVWRPRAVRRRPATAGSANPFQGRFTNPPRSNGAPADRGAMTRCHNCGTFFPGHQVVHDIVQGHLLEFCSQKCRDNFVNPGS